MKSEVGHHTAEDIGGLASEFFTTEMSQFSISTDRLFSNLMVVQWAFAIILSYFVTPKTALGASGESYVWTAVLIGGFLTVIPFMFNILKPGWEFNRFLNTTFQSLFSILFIYLTAGRTESHFHIFATLILCSLYFDVRVLSLACFIAVAQHFVGGMWYPETLFNATEGADTLWMEHVGWIGFATFFIGSLINRTRTQIEANAYSRAEVFIQNKSGNSAHNHKSIEKNQRHNLFKNFKDHLENISAALAEITGMVEANVRSAENVNSVAGEVHGVSESTRHVMEELTTAMQNILESNVRIEKLVKIIEQVAEKTEVIDEIVFKTQLLSFNASVEAERAGEHGRGFAVVAQEVGNLAQMSGKAATEIASIVKNSIREAEQVAAENKERVEKGGDLVTQTRERTSGVLNRITEILHATDQIVAASKEQSQGISEIAKSINMLNQQSNESVQSFEEEQHHHRSGFVRAS